jgi:hypothetical protein
VDSALFVQVDEDRSGEIDFEEFFDMMSSAQADAEESPREVAFEDGDGAEVRRPLRPCWRPC